MDSFLPDLMLTFAFMLSLEELKLFKQPDLVVLPGGRQYFFGSMSLKVSNHLGQIICADHQMEMVIEDNIAMEAQPLLLSAED